jgi:hypothetical protein
VHQSKWPVLIIGQYSRIFVGKHESASLEGFFFTLGLICQPHFLNFSSRNENFFKKIKLSN